MDVGLLNIAQGMLILLNGYYHNYNIFEKNCHCDDYWVRSSQMIVTITITIMLMMI